MSSFIIREMLEADIPAAIDVLKERGLYEADFDTPKALSDMQSTYPDLMLVAHVDDKVIGLVIGMYTPWASFIWHLCVREAYENVGAGTELKLEVHRRLKARGAKLGCSYVHPTNTRMRKFLKHFGGKEYSPVIPVVYEL